MPISQNTRMHGEIWESTGPESHLRRPINDELVGLLSDNSGRQRRDTGAADRQGTSWYGAVFLIVNAALGAGLLNFPQAFDQAGGVTVAITMQSVLMIFIVAALFILAYCSDRNGAKTLQDVVLDACGHRGQDLTSLCVAVYCFGTCVTFLIVIGDQYDRVLSSLYGNDFCHYWYMNRNFTMVASSLILILPLCYSRRIDFLKYVSFLGVIAVLYVVGLIIVKYFVMAPANVPVKSHPDVWTDVFLVVPTICFGYQCHVSAIPIYSCLKERSVRKFFASAIVAILLCLATYTAAATFGYSTFGSAVPSDILEAYDARDPFVLIGIIAIAIKTYTTYPIILFCGREAISVLWIKFRGETTVWAERMERCRRFTIATVWFASSLVLAVFTPNIGDAIKLLGSLAAIFLFVIPGICLLQLAVHSDPRLFLNKSLLLIAAAAMFLVIGMFLFGVVLMQGIERNMQDTSSAIQLCVP